MKSLRTIVAALLAIAGIVVAGELWLWGSDDSTESGTAAAGTGRPSTSGSATSADRLTFWTDCEQIVALTDDQLDEWQARGVDGFVCMVGRLQGMGGTQSFTGDPGADLSSEAYSLQRSIRDSRIVERADSRGMKLYLGAYLANSTNTATPLAEWFDDSGWSEQVLPRMRDLAAAAELMGFAGLAFDQELYPQAGGETTATWEWDYPGNTHSEEDVRAQARERGEELMGALLEDYPDLELSVYHAWFPGDWREHVYDVVNGVEETSTRTVHVDFWDGMTRAEGYRAIRFWDNIFYKTPYRGTWDSALTYNQNQVHATFSQRFSNWDYASERVFVSPFSWIDAGPNDESSFDDARPSEYVAEQLLAFRKWGMGGEFANYAYGSLSGFDYSPYVEALQDASSPAEIDSEPPELATTSAPEAGASEIQGTATDNLAIRSVRWRDDRGGSGTAEMSWNVLAGDDDSGYDWEMQWSIPIESISPEATKVAITAEDIKENESASAEYSLP